MRTTDCELCRAPGGEVLWDDGFARVVLVGDTDHPGFCRVILNAHCKEMTDLGELERARLMRIVFGVERLLRERLGADKINLASLGNLVPHLHWHVIPRFVDDPHFPNAVWGPRTGGAPRALPEGFRESLAGALGRLCG